MVEELTFNGLCLYNFWRTESLGTTKPSTKLALLLQHYSRNSFVQLYQLHCMFNSLRFRDGNNQQLGGCMRDFRNRPHPIRAKIRYYNNILTVSNFQK